jgi:hypothetical protein
MGKAFLYTSFKEYCRTNKIIGYFYQGDGGTKTIYGNPEDQDDDLKERNYHCERIINESDLEFVDTSRFEWYSKYIPLLELTFKDTNKRFVQDIFAEDGDHRIFYTLDCEEVGKQLMTNVFSTHEKLLDSAIKLCEQSLTLKVWEDYMTQWEEELEVFGKKEDWDAVRMERRRGNDKPNMLNSWPGAIGRPTQLLNDHAIEVIIQKMVTGANLQDQPFHIDDSQSCYTDDATRLNYGAVTMLLPGSREPADQVCTEISGLTRDWEQNGRGIWLPTNVLHRGRKPDYAQDRHVYLIEVHSNGNFVAKNGINGHRCENVKAFRMTLPELQAIKKKHSSGAYTCISQNTYFV